MGNVSKAIILVAIWLAFLSYANAQDAPEQIVGTKDGTYDLFTPAEVVAAGGGGPAGSANVYQFFEQRTLPITPITTTTQIIKDTPRKIGELPSSTFDTGLIPGPFYTFYEGDISINLLRNTRITLEIDTIHTFEPGKVLTSKRDITIGLRSGDNDIGLNQFNSVTRLAVGPVTLDDGTTYQITKQILADPVQLTVEVFLSFAATQSVGSLTAENARVSWVQLANAVQSGGSGDLSDATPIVEGVGAPGTAAKASRGDHIHPARVIPPGVQLSSKKPVVEAGTGAAGAGTAASRDDHVHPAAGGGADLPTGLVPVGTAGLCVKSKTAGENGELDYADCGSPRVLSNRNPLIEGTADPGNRTDVSRADHVHPTGGGGGGGTATPLSDVKPLVEGTADPGTASAASRGDHVHPARVIPPGVQLSSKKPVVEAGTGAAGAGTAASRDDHVHPARALPADELPAVTGNAGKPLRVKADASGPEWVDPHVLTLSGLPAITGHGGNVLAVNDGATAIEWKASGGSGGGTLELGASTYLFSQSGGSFTNGNEANFGGTGSGASPANVKLCADLTTELKAEDHWVTFTTTSADGKNVTVGGPFRSNHNLVGTAAYHFRFKGTKQTTNNYSEVDYAFELTDGRGALVTCYLFGVGAFTSGGKATLQVDIQTIEGAGGGGSSGPAIPAPTAGGALKHLRVAAGGNGYELADPPEGVPARGAGTVDRYKVLGMNSDGQTLRWADSSDIVGFGLQDISGLEGKCLVAGGTATAADGGESIAEWVDCITDDDVPELERDIDGLQALTGDLLLGRAEPGPSYVLNSVDKAGGLAWISGSSITPNLQGVTFQTNTVPRPGAGWGVGSMIIRIIDSEDVRMWQQRDSLPGADNVDISHWPGNQWREITPTNATEGYKYYLGHSPPNTSNVTQARLFRTNTSAHFGETEYYGKTPLVDAEIAKLDKEVLLWTQGFANLSDLEPSNNTAVSIGPNPSTAIRTAQLSRDPFRQFRLLIEFVDTVQDATPRSGYLQGWMAGAATGEPIANTETAKYYGALFDSRGTAQYIWLDSKNTGGSNLWVSTGTVTGDASNPAVTAYLYGYR